jgi:hypothetical protein
MLDVAVLEKSREIACWTVSTNQYQISKNLANGKLACYAEKGSRGAMTAPLDFGL